MNLEIIPMLKDAVTRTFMTMLAVDTVNVPDQNPVEPVWDIFGVIGFSGRLSGNIAICMTETAAHRVVERFTGESATGPDEVSDAVGELVNMIAGNAKTGFSEQGLALSLPEIIRGQGVKLDFKNSREQGSILFTSEIGLFKIVYAIR